MRPPTRRRNSSLAAIGSALLILWIAGPLTAQCSTDLSGRWQVLGATFCGVPFFGLTDVAQTGCTVAFSMVGLGSVEGTIDEATRQVDLVVTLPEGCEGTVPGVLEPNPDGGFDLFYGTGSVVCCRNGFGGMFRQEAPPPPPPPPPPGPQEPGAVRFVADLFEAQEGSGSVDVEVERVDGADGDVTVRLTTLEATGTATPQADYMTTDAVITWGDGEAGPRAVSLAVLDDDLDEGTEILRTRLSSPTGGAVIRGEETARVVLHDDDAPGTCDPDAASQLCLAAEGRFKVQVSWRNQQGERGRGEVVRLPLADSGLFTFFDRDNAELLVKVLDACSFADRFWVFFAGTTNQELTLTVTDTREGERRFYHHPLGELVAPVADTSAFATCP